MSYRSLGLIQPMLHSLAVGRADAALDGGTFWGGRADTAEGAHELATVANLRLTIAHKNLFQHLQ